MTRCVLFSSVAKLDEGLELVSHESKVCVSVCMYVPCVANESVLCVLVCVLCV